MKAAYYQGMLPLLFAVATAIAVENSRPGAADWELTNPALHQEIEGYASLTSVNTGDPIDLLVSTRATRYAIDVFRMGWYAGAGARRVAGPIVRNGIFQSVPPPAPESGLVECDCTAFVSTAPAISSDAGSTTPYVFSSAKDTT